MDIRVRVEIEYGGREVSVEEDMSHRLRLTPVQVAQALDDVVEKAKIAAFLSDREDQHE